ncbi:MAG TPA: HPr family phosphocarrier protein [Chthoniobacteraceae bacterium]|nr:HPr family phosphocarrier protein [Chthoniobacteraceae bacterium]
MLERHVTVLNQLGLHARPAAEFVRATRAFKAAIHFIKDGETYSGASILDVLSANLNHGAAFILRADGPDEEKALDHLCGLLEEFRRQEEREGM